VIKIPVPPHLTGPQASMLIELVDALIDWQQALRRTYHPWELEADQDWQDDIPF